MTGSSARLVVVLLGVILPASLAVTRAFAPQVPVRVPLRWAVPRVRAVITGTVRGREVKQFVFQARAGTRGGLEVESSAPDRLVIQVNRPGQSSDHTVYAFRATGGAATWTFDADGEYRLLIAAAAGTPRGTEVDYQVTLTMGAGDEPPPAAPASTEPAHADPPASAEPASAKPASTTPAPAEPATPTRANRDSPAAASPVTGSPASWIEKGACPFECCRYGTWTAARPLDVRERPDESAAVTGSVATGTSFRAITGETHTTAGRVRFVAADGDFAAGDELAIYDYTGEGFYRGWVNGRMQEVDLALALSAANPERRTARLEQAPVQVWWVQVDVPDGPKGWIRMPDNRAVTGHDECRASQAPRVPGFGGSGFGGSGFGGS
ncbi:MAG: hypothetical protein R2752_02395 [Vicinamibacterales bacterium]